MSFYAYTLRCAADNYYAGHTDNLERRVAQHVSGEMRGYTFKRRPVELVWSQDFPTRDEALKAEQQVKGWPRAKKEALARGDRRALSAAAVPPLERALGLRSGRTDDVAIGQGV